MVCGPNNDYSFGGVSPEEVPLEKLLLLALGFGWDGGGFGELKRQTRPGGESGIVFLVLSGALFQALGLDFVGRAPRVGGQVAVYSVDDDRRENHLQFVFVHFEDAASDLSASRKHGLSVHLDGLCDAGLERITPVIPGDGEGLADGRGDLCAFRQRDEVEWLRRIGGVASRVNRRASGCSAASNLRRLAAGYHGGLVRAPRRGQEAENRGRKR
jgi:hypothetical protein